MFTLTIETDNDAFSDGNTLQEVGRILRRAADKIEGGRESFNLLDANGNTVGKAELCRADSQDRESYTDTQDRENYTTHAHVLRSLRSENARKADA